VRRALYQSRKHDLGCPKSGVCTLFTQLGETRPCAADNGCKSFVGPAEDPPAASAMVRLSFLTRLSSMVNVGCKFAPNDLDPRTWSELIMVALERQRIDDIIRKGQDRKRDKDKPPPEAEKALRESRKALGLPEGGTSLFPQTKPMR